MLNPCCTVYGTGSNTWKLGYYYVSVSTKLVIDMQFDRDRTLKKFTACLPVGKDLYSPALYTNSSSKAYRLNRKHLWRAYELYMDQVSSAYLVLLGHLVGSFSGFWCTRGVSFADHLRRHFVNFALCIDSFQRGQHRSWKPSSLFHDSSKTWWGLFRIVRPALS